MSYPIVKGTLKTFVRVKTCYICIVNLYYAEETKKEMKKKSTLLRFENDAILFLRWKCKVYSCESGMKLFSLQLSVLFQLSLRLQSF